MILWQFEALSGLGFRKGCVIPERLALLLIKQKKYNKRFGEFEFEYFWDSDVVNKLIVNEAAHLHKHGLEYDRY